MCGKVFSAYITNLGKYVEGELIGQWVDFPTTRETIQEVFREIGIDREQYEEFFITDYESEIAGLTGCFGEYENLSMLNYLAGRIGECDAEWLEAAMALGEHANSVTGLLNLIGNEDCFLVYPDIKDDYDLGCYLIQESGIYTDVTEKMGVLAGYIDYEAFGRDVRLEEGGVYTDGGCYVYMAGTPVMSCMDSTEDIPEEYRLNA